jgi:hypothetical protein
VSSPFEVPAHLKFHLLVDGRQSRDPSTSARSARLRSESERTSVREARGRVFLSGGAQGAPEWKDLKTLLPSRNPSVTNLILLPVFVLRSLDCALRAPLGKTRPGSLAKRVGKEPRGQVFCCLLRLQPRDRRLGRAQASCAPTTDSLTRSLDDTRFGHGP